MYAHNLGTSVVASLCACKDNGADPPGNSIKAHTRQGANPALQVKLQQRQIKPDQPGGLQQWTDGFIRQSKSN